MPNRDLDIEFNESAFRDFTYISRFADKLNTIIEKANEVGPHPGLAHLASQIATRVDLPETKIRRVLVCLARMHTTLVDLKASPEEFLDFITESLETRATASRGAEPEDELKRFRDAKELILSALKSLGPDHAILLSQKSGRFVYSHANILKEARIITDIRPVFNDARTKIVHAVMTHVLSIDYMSNDGGQRIQFTMDANDVADLRKACDQAELKAGVLKEDLKSQGWPTIIFRSIR